MDSGRWPVQQSSRAVVDVSQSEVLADIEEAGAVSLRRTIRQAVAHIEPAPAGAKFLASNDGERNGVRPIIPDLDPSDAPTLASTARRRDGTRHIQSRDNK